MPANRAHEWISKNRWLCLAAGIILAILAFVPLVEDLKGSEPLKDGGEKQEDHSQENHLIDQVLVTYFHTTFRCPTCTMIERYSRETVESYFAREIDQKKIAFRHFNVQEPENEHFVKDYGLYTKSLIVSLNKDGKEVRWKNLPDIWKYVRNRERFEEYVRSEIEKFLKDL